MPSDDIEPTSGSPLAFDRVTFDRQTQSLTIAEGTSYDDWAAIGPGLEEINRSSNMWLGDWLVWGVQSFGDDAYQMVDADMADQSLRDLEWVCRQVPPSLRDAGLNFSHYRVVAAMRTKQERKRWLKKAMAEQWSGRRLRLEVDNDREPPTDTGNKTDPGGMMPDDAEPMRQVDPETGEVLTPDEVVQADGMARVVIVITGTDLKGMRRGADKLADAGATWFDRNLKTKTQVTVNHYDPENPR